jgi:hypothetical protein
MRGGDPARCLLVSEQGQHPTHGLVRRDVLHHAATAGCEPKSVLHREAPAGDECPELAQRVAGDEACVGYPCPDPERHARAIQGRLGEPRSVAHPIEGVLADRACGSLEKLRRDFPDHVAHVGGLTALAGK